MGDRKQTAVLPRSNNRYGNHASRNTNRHIGDIHYPACLGPLLDVARQAAPQRTQTRLGTHIVRPLFARKRHSQLPSPACTPRTRSMEIEKYIVSTDQELIDMSLAGDDVAFEYLFKRYREPILQLYVQRIGNSDDAADLLQETFLKVYLKLDSYNPKFTFGQWVYTIARNTFIDYSRKRRDDVSIDSLTSSYSAISPSAEAPTPEESYINRQQRTQLEQYMAKMTPRYQRLIELRFFRDYSYEEIAKELALPLGTVKTQIHRAREQLCRFIIENSDIMP